MLSFSIFAMMMAQLLIPHYAEDLHINISAHEVPRCWNTDTFLWCSFLYIITVLVWDGVEIQARLPFTIIKTTMLSISMVHKTEFFIPLSFSPYC